VRETYLHNLVETPPRRLCSHAYGGVEHNLSRVVPQRETSWAVTPLAAPSPRSEHRVNPCQTGALS
jgi:hypothetical protein